MNERVLLSEPRTIGARLGEVGGELVALDRHRRRDLHVHPLDPVRVEVVGEARGPVGPRRDLLADEPLGVVDQRGHQRARGRRCRGAPRAPAGRAPPRSSPRPGRRGRRASSAGSARWRGSPRRPSRPAPRGRTAAARAGGCPPGRSPCCRRRSSPGSRAADVAVVRGRRREADQALVEEDGLEDEDVLQVDPAVEGVVHHEHVAGAQLVAPLGEEGRHRVRDRAQVEGDGDALRDGLAVAGRRSRRRSPCRRGRRSSARCGRSSSPSRRRSTRARCRRSAGSPGRRAWRVSWPLQDERLGGRVAADGPARADDDRGVVLVDQDRPRLGARADRGARPHRRLDVPRRRSGRASTLRPRRGTRRGGTRLRRATGRCPRAAAPGSRSASRARRARRRAARARPRTGRSARAHVERRSPARPRPPSSGRRSGARRS